MSDADKLRKALAWHDYAEQYMLDAIADLLTATDFDVTPPGRHEARDRAESDLRKAYKALENARVLRGG